METETATVAESDLSTSADATVGAVFKSLSLTIAITVLSKLFESGSAPNAVAELTICPDDDKDVSVNSNIGKTEKVRGSRA